MTELWQLYDEQAQPLAGQGATKDEIFAQGLLHGAAHVWIWRQTNAGVEVLLQKRAAAKRTWPNLYDISAAGHIDLGESPLQAAERETSEELGITVGKTALQFIGIHRCHMAAGDNIENEHRWLYLLEFPDDTKLKLQEAEVGSTEWQSLETFKIKTHQQPELYVPHGDAYFDTIIAAIEAARA